MVIGYTTVCWFEACLRKMWQLAHFFPAILYWHQKILARRWWRFFLVKQNTCSWNISGHLWQKQTKSDWKNFPQKPKLAREFIFTWKYQAVGFRIYLDVKIVLHRTVNLLYCFLLQSIMICNLFEMHYLKLTWLIG